MSSLLHAVPDHENYSVCVFKKFQFKWKDLCLDQIYCKKDVKSDNFPEITSEYSWFIELNRGYCRWSHISFELVLNEYKGSEVFTEYTIFVKADNHEVFKTGDFFIFSNDRLRTPYKELDINSYVGMKQKFDICVTVYAQIHSGPTIMKGIHQYRKMRDLLSSLGKGDDSTDVVIKVDSEEIKCHRCILSSRSSYFCTMFGSDMNERKRNTIEITDFDVDTINSMITFLYTFECPKLPVQSTIRLLEAAEKYQMDDLKDACEKHLISETNASNVVDFLLHSDFHSAQKLKQKAMDFIDKNFSEAEQYEPLMTRPDLLRAILLSNVNSD